MKLTRLYAAAALLLATSAHAGSIQSLAGLQGIRVYEATYVLAHSADFALGDARLTSRITGASLTQATRDFGFYSGNENYDLFFSDADGTLNANGSYLSIEGNCDVPYNCFNITEIALVKAGGALELANAVASASYGRPGSYTPGSAGRAVDGSFSTYTQLGDTIGLPADARMRITVGFASTPPVPEPETYALMLVGLGLVAWTARRRNPLSAT